MQEQRHSHPHKDPRQPRHCAIPGTNPPVFAWKPLAGQTSFGLHIARDPAFNQLALDVPVLNDCLFLPARALPSGRYFWRWTSGQFVSPVFEFTLTETATVVEIPPVDAWLQALSQQHPRIYLRPEEVENLRTRTNPGRTGLHDQLLRDANALLVESHQISEPPKLPDKKRHYNAFFSRWYPTLWNSRRFVKGAETLALAHLATNDVAYGRAACVRMAAICRWDPEGTSHISHNDEAHMSLIWHGANACDWVWGLFTEQERQRVIAQFCRRGEITFEYMHDRGAYGIHRFDSHAGREIVFLAHIALVFHEYIPQAQRWLEWLRPVLCGIWPIWASDDGAWAEGPSYGLAYVTIMTMFASALKKITGTDLYHRPFWKNHALWRYYCMPSYAEWIGFGDHSQRWAETWRNNADLVELIARQTQTPMLTPYVEALREQSGFLTTPEERRMPGINAQLYLAPLLKTHFEPNGGPGIFRHFPDTGWAAIRTHLHEPAQDVALIFRSSPYGSVSHSHANNNDFILHVGGRCIAMPSGYYGVAGSGYGSDHHAHWLWHTKSHNCLTLSDAPQIMRSHDSTGAIVHPFEDHRLVYFCGHADASYRDRAVRCRRHVVFLKSHCVFIMVDEFVAVPGIVSALQWNLHGWDRFTVESITHESTTHRFSVQRGDSQLTGHFLHHDNGFFTQSEGWDPPPAKLPDPVVPPQYNLRFTPSGLVERCNLGVVLCPAHADLKAATVRTERGATAEMAHIGADQILVNRDGRIVDGSIDTIALMVLTIQDQQYEIGDQGIAIKD